MRKRKWRKPLLMLAVFLPQGLKTFIYRRLLHWKIGKGVKIGFSYIDSDNVVVGDNVRIGHLNIVRGLRLLEIGQDTYIANFNQIFGASFYSSNFVSALQIGERVNFMSHHFVDVAGAVEIGDRTTIGGRDTHFWSHSIYLRDGVRVMEPTQVCIGMDVYVGARATLVGCAVPNGAFVGAGSVVTKSFPSEPCRLLIAGNPAVVKKRYTVVELSATGVDLEEFAPADAGRCGL